MITDRIENINLYPQIPNYAKDFIANLSNKIELGKYILKEDDFANIETYTTKKLEDAKFEVHNKYADIQILLNGNERIYVKNKHNLLEEIDFNNDKDIGFYSSPVEKSDFTTLDGTNFIMIFPHEAHAPQVAIENNQTIVKKVVLKIKI